MRKETKTIIKLSVKEILLSLVDINIYIVEIFDGYKIYKKPIRSYWEKRDLDKIAFSKSLYRLKKQNLIRDYVDEKDRYLEITEQGLEKIKSYAINDLKINIPTAWDKKWRIVIFDIPNEERKTRNIFRSRLKQLGFLKLQKSVFIFPYECKEEIDFLKRVYGIEAYVIYILADQLETDTDLIKLFFDKEIIK